MKVKTNQNNRPHPSIGILLTPIIVHYANCLACQQTGISLIAREDGDHTCTGVSLTQPVTFQLRASQLTEPVCAITTLGSENFQHAVGSTGHAHSTLNETSLITSKFRSIVAIQKFCYHGNVTPHFSLFPVKKSLVIFSMDCLLFKHSK